jgi:hypothetical protein
MAEISHVPITSSRRGPSGVHSACFYGAEVLQAPAVTMTLSPAFNLFHNLQHASMSSP